MISADDAVTRARESVPLVGDSVPTQELVLLTDEAYGPVDNADTVDPYFVDKPSWAVVFLG